MEMFREELRTAGGPMKSSVATYERNCQRWFKFCEQQGISPLVEVSERSERERLVLTFLRGVSLEGALHGRSIESTISAINWYYRRAERTSPFGGGARGVPLHDAVLVGGLTRLTAVAREAASPVTVDEMFGIVQVAGAAWHRRDWVLVRAGAAAVFAFVMMARASTVAGQKRSGIFLTSSTSCEVLLSKEKGRSTLEVVRRLVWTRCGQVDRGEWHPFDLLLHFFQHQMETRGDGWLFSLPSEAAPSVATVNGWMDLAMSSIGYERRRRGVSHHDYRRGGAACALMAGVSQAVVRRVGGWKSDDAMMPYVSVVPTSARSKLFFGHLLPQGG